MIGKINRPMLPFNNVVAAGVATAQIMPGQTIDGVTLVLGGTSLTAAMLTNIKFKANGKAFLNITGTQAAKIHQFKHGGTVSTHLPIHFADLIGKDAHDRAVGAFDTSVGIANVTVEVTIAGATAPTLKGILHEAAPQSGMKYAPMMTKYLSYPYVSGAGELSIPLPFGPVNGGIIKRIFVFEGTAGYMTGALVKQNGVVVHESLDADNDAFNVMHGRTNQTGLYALDFVADGIMADAFDTRDARSLELRPTFSTADTGTVVVEYLDVLGNL